MKHYRIVVEKGNNIRTFEDKCSELVEEGYRPVGNIDTNAGNLVQAFYKPMAEVIADAKKPAVKRAVKAKTNASEPKDEEPRED